MGKPYAVLGCGPAGLLAAHALSMFGRRVIVFSAKQKSVLGGAQYSHVQIPLLTSEEPEAELTYRVVGDAQVYQSKVYGDAPIPFVSFDHVVDGKRVPAWSLAEMYDKLWDMWQDQIFPMEIDHDVASKLSEIFHVVSSVPLTAICEGHHTFRSQMVQIANVVPVDLPDNTIMYSGDPADAYYRKSLIFGTSSMEWGVSAALPPSVRVRAVRKPIESNCDCLPQIERVGRYGRWQKGILTHHGARDLMARLDAGEMP
jgi:hypothetical protein